MSSRSGSEYHLRDDGIYHLVFHNFQHRTIDQYFRHLEAIYPHIPPDTHIKLLLDARPAQGFILMLKYIIEKSREFEKKHPGRPPVVMAIVIEMNIFTRLLDSTLRVFVRSRDQLRFFDLPQFENAIDWIQQAAVTSEA
jgi:hypothetical protein